MKSNKIKRSISVLSCFSAIMLMCGFNNCNTFGNAAEEPAEKSQPSDTSGVNKRLFIGIWSPNLTSTKEAADIEYKLIADAGINLIWSERYDDYEMAKYKLGISEQLDLKHIVPLWVEPKPNTAMQDADIARWKEIVDKYKDYPAVTGFGKDSSQRQGKI